MKVEEIIELFEAEFSTVSSKFAVLRVLNGIRELDYDVIYNLQLPSGDNNITWHPGVYVFFGNGKPYRVGRHLDNSRKRVLEHLTARTGNADANVWDIKDFPDREILLFNVINRDDYHWVAAVEIFLEKVLKSELAIPASRQG